MIVFVSLWLGAVSQTGTMPTKVRHDFYVSVTDLNVDISKGVLTGVVKTFPDDWERAMNELLKEKVQRYISLDSAAQYDLHAGYIESHLKLLWTERYFPLPFMRQQTARMNCIYCSSLITARNHWKTYLVNGAFEMKSLQISTRHRKTLSSFITTGLRRPTVVERGITTHLRSIFNVLL